jgi:uncharacterized protein YegL
VSVPGDPGGALAARPLHFVWILDCSRSMAAQAKMESLNHAIHAAQPSMRGVNRGHPHAEMLVSVLAFSEGARWVTERPVPVDDFSWTDLEPTGMGTDLGAALRLLARDLGPMVGERALPPNLVLVSDGQPTDDWRGGLQELFAVPWGQRSVRNAIAIGKDAAHAEALEKFIGTPGRFPLGASNPQDLVEWIEWVSTVPVAQSSEIRSSKDEPPPTLPPRQKMVSDVW